MAAVTPAMRIAGWNVEFTIGSLTEPDVFAGIYQVQANNIVTFHDLREEMRLCFGWDTIAFSKHGNSPLITEMYEAVPTSSLRIWYHVVSHKNCLHPSNDSLVGHLKAGCAQQLSEPSQRYDPRYVPLTESKSHDPKLSFMPLRKQPKLSHPAKRSADGTPKEQYLDNTDDIGFEDMLAPQNSNIDTDEARRVKSRFQASCLHGGSCCVVTGEGKPWCAGMPIGPGVEACQIIPQREYHLYPLGGDNDGLALHGRSPHDLRMAWEKTWSLKNGILLMKHLHQFFDERLFSIHPETLRIRVFVPCDALLKFNGKPALVSRQVDRKALRQHYEMCCIENMAALKIYWHDKLSKLHPPTDLPPTPVAGDTQVEIISSRPVNPSKRPPSNPPNQVQPENASGQDNSVQEAEVTLLEGGRGCKRRRLGEREVDNQTSLPPTWYGEDLQIISSPFSFGFLAGLSSES